LIVDMAISDDESVIWHFDLSDGLTFWTLGMDELLGFSGLRHRLRRCCCA